MYCGCGRATPSEISGKRSAARTIASKAAHRAAISPPSVAWTFGSPSAVCTSASRSARPAMNSSFTPNRTSAWKLAVVCEGVSWNRSEEHTSELQSLAYLVCRLLLEKKKKELRTDSTDV